MKDATRNPSSKTLMMNGIIRKRQKAKPDQKAIVKIRLTETKRDIEWLRFFRRLIRTNTVDVVMRPVKNQPMKLGRHSIIDAGSKPNPYT
jgi:hypothetical protein